MVPFMSQKSVGLAFLTVYCTRKFSSQTIRLRILTTTRSSLSIILTAFSTQAHCSKAIFRPFVNVFCTFRIAATENNSTALLSQRYSVLVDHILHYVRKILFTNHQLSGLVVSVFANGLVDRDSILGCSDTKDQRKKWYLKLPCLSLSIIRYVSRLVEWRPVRCSCYWTGDFRATHFTNFFKSIFTINQF